MASIKRDGPPGPDKGFDILAHKDPLGTSPPRIKVQVKRRADKVGVDVLRSFVAVLGDQDVGIFLATGGFTKEAADLARTQETRKITLLGMEELFDLWVQCYDKIPEMDKNFSPLGLSITVLRLIEVRASYWKNSRPQATKRLNAR